MSKSIKKTVLKQPSRPANKSTAEQEPRRTPPQPVAIFRYPRHGMGEPIPRIVRLTEADSRYVRGFQLRHEFDVAPGEPKTFDRKKIDGPVVLLHLAPSVE